MVFSVFWKWEEGVLGEGKRVLEITFYDAFMV